MFTKGIEHLPENPYSVLVPKLPSYLITVKKNVKYKIFIMSITFHLS